jgi:benzil reductase ((S)-benzoin forming)
MKYVIVTGASRGLGEAVAHQLLASAEMIHLIYVNRKENKKLKERAAEMNRPLDFISADFSGTERLAELMERIFEHIDTLHATGLYLINNAGIVDPVKPLSRCDETEILKNLQINLAAPMILTSTFIRIAEGLPLEKRVLTVTSGASKRAVYGWSAYCSSKAGVNLFTACASEEERQKENGAQLVAFSPGIMDTDMQRRIRSADPDDFSQVDQFIRYKEEGELRPPELVADALTRLLFSADFPGGEFVDIKDLLQTQSDR